MIYGLTKQQYDACKRNGISPGTLADSMGAATCDERRQLHNDDAALRDAQRCEFASMLAERDREFGLQIWFDGDKLLVLGYERPGGRGFVILARVFLDGRIVAVPPRIAKVDIAGTYRDGDVALKPWLQQRAAEKLSNYKLYVPRGVL